MNQSQRLKVLVILLGLLTGLLLYHHRLATNGDNLDYILIARDVLRGDIFNPFLWRFPVGYPYWVSAVLGITGYVPSEGFLAISSLHINVLKLSGVFLLVPILWLAFKWAGTVKASHPVLLITFIATSQCFTTIFSVIGSEPLFILFSITALYLWERLAEINNQQKEKNTPNQHHSLLFFTGLATFAAIQFRQIGLSLPVATILYTVVTGGWRSRFWRKSIFASAILPLVISLLLMLITNYAHLGFLFSQSGIGDHSEQPAFNLTDRIITNIDTYKFTVVGILFQKVLGSNGILGLLHLEVLTIPIAIVAILIVLLGAFVVLTNKHKSGFISLLYLLISISIIVIWPFQSGRFFVPLVPLIVWLFYLGMEHIFYICRIDSRYLTMVLSVLVMMQILTNGYAGIKNVRNIWRWRQAPAWYHERYLPTEEFDFADMLECGEWLQENSEKNCLVVASKALFIQVSGKRSSFYPSKLSEQFDLARDKNTPFYVIADSFPDTCSYGRMKHEYIFPFIDKHKSLFEPVHVAPYSGATIYKLHNNRLHSYVFSASEKNEGEP